MHHSIDAQGLELGKFLCAFSLFLLTHTVVQFVTRFYLQYYFSFTLNHILKLSDWETKKKEELWSVLNKPLWLALYSMFGVTGWIHFAWCLCLAKRTRKEVVLQNVSFNKNQDLTLFFVLIFLMYLFNIQKLFISYSYKGNIMVM